MVFTSLPMHKKPIPVVLEKIGSYLIPIEEITGTIVNRASYLKRFVGLQKNPRKHKYFEIKTYYQKTDIIFSSVMRKFGRADAISMFLPL